MAARGDVVTAATVAFEFGAKTWTYDGGVSGARGACAALWRL